MAFLSSLITSALTGPVGATGPAGSLGTSTQITTIAVTSNTSHYLLFVDANNNTSGAETVYTTSSFVINPNTGNIGLGITAPTTKLDISGGLKVTSITTLTNTTAATSTTTGALQVSGGVGIGGSLYVGGEVVAQKLTIELTTVTTTLIQTDDVIKTTNTTNATSTTTGALQVSGGAGIGRDLYVGGSIYGSIGSSSTVTGKLQAYTETINTIGAVATNTNIDTSLANIVDVTLAASGVTFTFTNPPASGTSRPVTVILRQDSTGTRTATFANAKYTDGVLPVLSTNSNAIDVLTFFTVNGGTTWLGTFAMANVS